MESNKKDEPSGHPDFLPRGTFRTVRQQGGTQQSTILLSQGVRDLSWWRLSSTLEEYWKAELYSQKSAINVHAHPLECLVEYFTAHTSVIPKEAGQETTTG